MHIYLVEQRDVILPQTEPTSLPVNQDDFEPPNLEGWQNDIEMSDDNMPQELEENENLNGTTEEAVERMHLRQRAADPISAVFYYLSSPLIQIYVLRHDQVGGS